MFLIPISVEPDDNSTFLITCPVLPEVTTFAETRDEVQGRALDAIEEAIAARIAEWKLPIVLIGSPTAEHVKLPLLPSLKLALFNACIEQGVTRAELVRRMGVAREQVDRLFRLDHASRTDQIEHAFKVLGKTVDVEVREFA